MRAQTGTTTLRALVYFDEIYGYLPPTSNPPSERIIGGPGSFVVTADGPESFAAAVKRKLILEIAGTVPRFAAAE